MKPLVAIVVLNWNGWQDTLECLESLYQITYPNYQVILVDNHSQDQSLEKIREYCQGHLPIESPFFTYQTKNKPIKITELTNQQTEQQQPTNKRTEQATRKNNHENNKTENKPEKTTNIHKNQQNPNKPSKTITLIKNNKNYGFAQGNNIAIKYTLKKHNPDYILLLNNDTIVDPEFLTEMVKARDIDDRIGIVGAKLLNAYNPQIIDSTGHVISWGRIIDRGHGKVDHGQYDRRTQVMGAMAAAALFKKEMLLDIGLLDTSYVTLGEDADLSWKAHNASWKAIYTPKAIVYHKRGQSITKKSVIPKMTVLSTKNTVEYVTRYGNFSHKFLFLFVLLKEGLFVLVGSIIGRNEINAREYFNMLMKSYLKIFRSF